MIALQVVERPTPLRPSKLTISPSPTARSTPCRMWLLPYRACRSRTSSIMPASSCCNRPEIGLLHGGVAADGSGRIRGDDLAVDQHGDAVGEAEHHAHVVLHHEQRLGFRHTADQLDGGICLAVAHTRGW